MAKRVQLKDFSGALLSELSATLKNARPAFAPLYANQYSHHSSSSGLPYCLWYQVWHPQQAV
ncbi:hypothetical protein CVS40_2965 [Lucilia cuprina]|nr:hypothetical protein CVS40_2965 [Lucilia cuprina]